MLIVLFYLTYCYLYLVNLIENAVLYICTDWFETHRWMWNSNGHSHSGT